MAERLDMNSLNKFDGNNYNQWRFQMNCALRAKGLYNIVHGVEQKPEADGDPQKVWVKSDATAMFILTSALDYSQITLIENCESSHQIIGKLDSIYLQRSESSKMIAHERFHQYRMKENESIAQHIANVENLAKKLKDIGEAVSDAAIMTKIISTLPPKFRNFRQAWLSVSEDRQTLANLTSRLVDEDANLSLFEQSETAFTASSGRNQFWKSHKSTKQNPSGGKPQSGGSSKPKSDHQNQHDRKPTVVCYQCRKRGHIARFCRNKPKSSNEDKEYSSFIVEFPGGVDNMKDTWIMDSGASAHMSYRVEQFSNLKEVTRETTVVIGNNVSLPVMGRGDIEIEKLVKGEWHKSIITNVLLVPDLKRNLFSEAVVTKKGWSIVKQGKKAEILEGSKLIASATLDDNNVYQMLFRMAAPHQAYHVTENSLSAWHDRLGHVNFTRIRSMIKNGVITGIALSDEDEILCESCLYGKQHRSPHPSRKVRMEKVGERVFSDVCGPITTESSGGARYFVLFKDSATSYLTVNTMKHKSDVPARLKEYVQMVEKQNSCKVKALHCDNGREYINEDLLGYLKKEGIILENTSPYTPQQNGRVEREMRTVMESARSMMHAMNAPKYLWGEAVNTAVYILNRTPTSEKVSTTPFEAFTGRKPTLSHLKKFGCTAFMHIPDSQRTKLDDKSSKLMFVGYDGNSDNYRLFDPATRKVKVSRNVIFDEHTTVDAEKRTVQIRIAPVESVDDNDEEDPGNGGQESVQSAAPNQAAPKVKPLVERHPATEIAEPRRDLDGAGHAYSRQRNVETAQEGGGAATDATRDYNLRKRDNLRPPARYTANIAVVKEPQTYSEAIASRESKEWLKAITEELNALERNNTWQLVKRTGNMKVIGSKWVFSIKDVSSNKPRFKARLCAKGFSQEKGVDYDEVFSPTTRFDSIRILLATAVKNDFKIVQFDVRTAFLYGDLQETIYMDPPEGADVSGDEVCRLQKSLYGLKQASRCWNEKFNRFMLEKGFRRGEADKCVYRNSDTSSTIILILYVDDGLVMSSDDVLLHSFVDQLRMQFEIKVSQPGHFVGMEILDETDENRDRRIFIHQSNYIRRVIEKFRMQDAAAVSTPADPHVRLKKPDDDEGSEEICPYREAVGSLMFAAIVTRPDIMFATNQVSRYTSNNDSTHWNAVKRILKYLKGTENLGIEYRKDSKMSQVVGYSDSDFGNDLDTRRSTSGYVFLLSNGAVTWSSQIQKAVTLSTTEAEYVAASEAAKETTWIRQFLDDIGEPVREATTLKMDNQGALCLVKNPVFHKRTKHVDIKFHHIREKLEEGIINVSYVPSDLELADVFTKPTPRDHFNKLVFSLGMRKD